MAYDEMLVRRSEMLKKRIGAMIAKENQYGLGKQEGQFLRRMIRELHQTAYEMNAKAEV
ncbi:hypothetical protein J25TS5_16570 [Paenibacillus faecis]|uniref:hypothetical protein n=1 Tax=Paenibacillus TaxID=44249 RepID=UPI0014796E53|nr:MULTISPECIES: hypothetical protein [Paenibacillus]MCA1296510.1 hypothetical protein [Paenibacillus sp. alder61]GIO84725.1 hypothetical protein J25TS5_16570 [Paenibacillus faecis]